MSKYLIKEKQQIAITVIDINDMLEYDMTMGDLYVSFCELGFGVFTKRKFKKGEHIYTFKGVVINFEQTKQINDDTGECRALQIDVNKYINTQAPGRYINHSCEPNSGIINTFELIALEDIPENAELRFDYSTSMDEDHFTMDCFCGKPTCRHIVEDFKRIPISKQQSYLEQGIVMDFIKKQYAVEL